MPTCSPPHPPTRAHAAELEYKVSQTNSLITCASSIVLHASAMPPPPASDKGAPPPPGKPADPPPQNWCVVLGFYSYNH